MGSIFRFGEFRLDAAGRQLWLGDDPVILTARAMDTLIVLVRNSGRVVSKEELIGEVWNDVVVDENNLNQQISLLRKTLGDDGAQHRYIDTVPRKGYCFVASVEELTEPARPRWSFSWSPSRVTLAFGLLVLLATLAVAPTLRFTADAAPPISNLAVLPLTSDAADPSLDYFGSGFVEDLTQRLRRGGGLRVQSASRQPVKLGVRAMAKTMGADAVLTGSIVRSAKVMRFTLQLEDTRSGKRLWSRTFESKPEQVIELPAVAAREIEDFLGLAVGDEPERAQPSFEAYEAYLKGRHHWNRRTPQNFEKAVEHYRRAIALEPEYAEAHAGLAMALGFLNRAVESRMVARRALALDSSLPELRAFLALTLLHDFNPELSRKEFERAVLVGPDSAVVHHWYAFYFSYTSQHDRAIAEIRRAHQLDPMSSIISTDVGVILLWAGRHQEAVEELRKVLDLDPTFWNAHAYLALCYEQLGRPEDALKEWRSLRPQLLAEVPTLVRLGRADEAKERINEELRRVAADPSYLSSPTAVSQAFAALGELDLAFEWLERAYRQRFADLMTLAVDRRFDPLRPDPRFTEMLVRLNLLDVAPHPSLSQSAAR